MIVDVKKLKQEALEAYLCSQHQRLKSVDRGDWLELKKITANIDVATSEIARREKRASGGKREK